MTEMEPLTPTEQEFSLMVGNALRLVVKGAFVTLREKLENGQVRPEVGQVIMGMQLATASATVAHQVRVGPQLMKEFFDQAYRSKEEEEKASHHEPGNA